MTTARDNHAVIRTVVAFHNRLTTRHQEEERFHAAIYQDQDQFSRRQGREGEEIFPAAMHEDPDDTAVEEEFINDEEFDDEDPDDTAFEEEFINDEEFDDDPDDTAVEEEFINDEEFDDDDDDYNDELEDENETPLPQIPLDQLKKKTVMMEEERATCAICLEDMEVGEEGMVLECSHMFHETCLLRWLSNKLFCPLCRFKIFSSATP